MLGLRPVLLAGGRDLDRGDQRLGRVGHRRRELVAVKALVLSSCGRGASRIDRRDDPIGARAAVQPRDAVFVDVEVLADQLAQQPMRVGDRARRRAARRACSTARSARSASWATRVSIRSRSAFSRQRQSGLSLGRR